MKENLGLIVLDSHKELGEKINNIINNIRGTDKSYIIPLVNDRFSNGEGKITIKGSVREKDIYILADVGNYNLTYNMHGYLNHVSPDEHYQDIKRVISAISGHAKRVNVVMPLLYQSRQHKRKGRESLDCAVALRELESLGVNNILTIDAHDASICNAIPNTSFNNFYPTKLILDKLREDIGEDVNSSIVISPDMGATERAKYYADSLKCDMGVFYKRRDLTKVIDGKNPIIEHAYMGPSVKDKMVIVVDDMIASGTSIIEVGKMLKERGAEKVYFLVSFALFTEGVSSFKDAYNNGYFDAIYSTNSSYIPKDITDEEWFNLVDTSNLLANVINDLNNGDSLERYFN